MFVMNEHCHFFEIDTKEIIVNSELFHECRFFDNEEALLQAVCSMTGCSLDEVEGSTFLITKKDGLPVVVDDRCFAGRIDGAVETFVSTFVL
jgi:hypothetical protein